MATNIKSQRLINTAIVAVVKVNNITGSMSSACNYLSEAMEKDSKDLGDKVYGDIWDSTIESDSEFEWSSKTLAYKVKVTKNPEETTLSLIRDQYIYD